MKTTSQRKYVKREMQTLGLWPMFRDATQPIGWVADEQRRRIFYQQKGYADPKHNFLTLIECDDDAEFKHVVSQLAARAKTATTTESCVFSINPEEN